MSAFRRILDTVRRRAALAVISVALAACDHPIAVVTPHAEVADLVVSDASGAILARTRDNRRWEGGPIAVCDGKTLELRSALLDFQGQAVDLAARRDLSLRGEVDGAPIATYEPLNTVAGDARARGRLHAHLDGTTRVRFLVWHVTHADLVTPWLDIVVHPASAPTCAA